MQILIAPNAFKHSLSAGDAAEAIREGLMQSSLVCQCICFPVGDGGDGTGELLAQHFSAGFVKVTVSDPLGNPIESRFAYLPARQTAIIEMADASGIRLLSKHQLNPLQSNSYGTGELIKAALEKGARRIILAIGGSATVDGAAGILHALGTRFLDERRNPLKVVPAAMHHLDEVDLTSLSTRLAGTEITVLCDVENYLLGDSGAAKTFGPQKGARPDEVLLLEAGLEKFRDVVLKQTGRDMQSYKHGGAAGGVAAGLAAVAGAKLVNGIDFFLKETGFEEAVVNADLIITGEGSVDEQTLQGKAPFGVAVAAKSKSKPVIAISGRLDLEPSQNLYKCFDVLLPLSNAPSTLDEALGNCRQNLIRTAREIGNMLHLAGKG
jgi:glycerate kinase